MILKLRSHISIFWLWLSGHLPSFCNSYENWLVNDYGSPTNAGPTHTDPCFQHCGVFRHDWNNTCWVIICCWRPATWPNPLPFQVERLCLVIFCRWRPAAWPDPYSHWFIPTSFCLCSHLCLAHQWWFLQCAYLSYYSLRHLSMRWSILGGCIYLSSGFCNASWSVRPHCP